jgi:hypothetical protein
MIGGVEVDLPTRAGANALTAAVRAIRRVEGWRRAVFENATSGDAYPRFEDVPFGQLSELFVYRDAEAKRIWDDEGAVPQASNTMIHLISDEYGLTAVVDDDDAEEMRIILEAIRSLLGDELLERAAA